MRIRLNDNLRITSDPHNFVVEIMGKAGKWKQVEWYTTFDGLLTGVMNRQLRNSTATSLCELAEDIKAVRGQISLLAAPKRKGAE